MDSHGNGENIQRRMRDLRQEFDSDMLRVVADARELTDWRHYVRTYPWLCVGLAAAVGYLVVPGRTPRESVRVDLASLRELLREGKAFEVTPQRPRQSLAGTLLGVAATSLLRTAIGVAAQHWSRRNAAASGSNVP